MSSVSSGNGFHQAMYIWYNHCRPVYFWKLRGCFPINLLLFNCFHLSSDPFDAPVWIPATCECRVDVVVFLLSIFLFCYDVSISFQKS